MCITEVFRIRGIGALLGGCSGICYASSATVVKLLSDQFDVIFLTLTRCIVMSMLTLIPIIYRPSKFWEVSIKDAVKIVLVSLNSVGLVAFLYKSTQLLDISVSVTLFSTFPVFVAIFSRIFLHRKLQKQDVFLIVVCIIGVLMCTLPGLIVSVNGLNGLISNTFAIGCAFALIAAIINAGSLVMFQSLDNVNVLNFTLMESLAATIILFVYHIISRRFPTFTMYQFLLIFSNGVLAWFAAVLVFIGLKLDSAVLVSIGRISEIIMAIILNFIIFHASVNVLSIIGSIIITAGILTPSITYLYQN